MVASVLIEYSAKSLNKTFDYLVPFNMQKKIKVGHKVIVPFGKVVVEGFVLCIKSKYDESLEYKEITKIIEEDFYLNGELLLLGKNMSESLLCNLISCYQVMLPRALKAKKNTSIKRKYENYIVLNIKNIYEYIDKNKRKNREISILKLLHEKKEVLKKEISGASLNNLIKNGIVKEEKREINRIVNHITYEKKDIVLTTDQSNAYDEIINSSERNFLIYGVTGSGKTEVYISLIKYYLSIGKNACFLVPEISLTPQIISRFYSEFGEEIALLHSGLSEGEKYDEYRKVNSGNARIVVGARSAVFAPLKNIGIFIIDECSSVSYKQENNPKYDAIDIAMKRSIYHNAKCIIGSATPSLEQYARALKGVYKLITLDKRINNSMPDVKIVDMEKESKKRNYILSGELVCKIKERLEKKEQVILLLNRRGYSTFVSCSNCGFAYKCPSCDITLTYHKSTNNLRCHYCGYSTKYSDICPNCSQHSLKDLGLGTEKLEKLISKKFESAKVLRMDTDTTSTKNSHEKLIDSFKNREYDILVGTQMISKGLNFPYVTLVGIINADTSLLIPDFRSGERTFELLMQTSGRSGRNDKKGQVIVQTYNADNYVFKYVKNSDYVGFYNKEMTIRKALLYPPYFYLCYLKIVSDNYEKARNESAKIKKHLDKKLDNNFIILGPSTAKIFKFKNNYHFGIIIKYKKRNNLFEVLKELNESYVTSGVKLDIDINPLNTL